MLIQFFPSIILSRTQLCMQLRRPKLNFGGYLDVLCIYFLYLKNRKFWLLLDGSFDRLLTQFLEFFVYFLLLYEGSLDSNFLSLCELNSEIPFSKWFAFSIIDIMKNPKLSILNIDFINILAPLCKGKRKGRCRVQASRLGR